MSSHRVSLKWASFCASDIDASRAWASETGPIVSRIIPPVASVKILKPRIKAIKVSKRRVSVDVLVSPLLIIDLLSIRSFPRSYLVLGRSLYLSLPEVAVSCIGIFFGGNGLDPAVLDVF